MASSPPYSQLSAISPPYPSNVQLPQPPKRRQTDMPTSGPAIKRRKASMLSTTSASSHPLRQTSFPPENNAQTPRFSRSPSMDNMSLASGVSGAKKKRPRKSKGKTNDDDSIIGGKARSTTSANSRGRHGRRQSRDESGEDEEEGGEELALDKTEATKEEAQREREQQAMLINAFDPEQASRHGAWKASRLGDAVVRRIINQTLSQSVPQSVILAVRGAAKVYAGEIISGARRVQAQWDEVDEEAKKKLPPPSLAGSDVKRAPLLPEHLAESYRRHRVAREGDSTGQLGLWQLQQSTGVERFGSKVGGKRLFK